MAAKNETSYIRIEMQEWSVEGEGYSLTFYDIQCEPERVEQSQEVCTDYEDRAVQFEAKYNLDEVQSGKFLGYKEVNKGERTSAQRG